MKTILRNILAVVAGLVIGGAINMAIIMVSGKIIPPPAGADLTTEAGLKASMHLFTPINFLMPFLAHALGTFVGALITTLIAASNKMRLALVIGIFSFIGGAMEVAALPSPLWFSIIDLAGAYIPMAILGYKLGDKK